MSAKRVLFVAGEASGDAQAARLAAEMAARRGDLYMYGVGGPALRAAGVDTVIDCAELSFMGFSEVASGLGRALSAYRRLRAELRGPDAPSLLVLVDFPDFNLPLARAAKRAGVRVLYYISPQVWAWRRRRIAKIARRVDRMIVLFPFEEEIYRGRGVDARFVGHPLAESVVATSTRKETRARHGLPADRPLIALLPGSRRKEVTRHLGPMLGAARALSDRAAFALVRAPGLDPAQIEAQLADAGVDVAVVAEDAYNLLAASDAAVVASGTATIECALLGCPMVVVYRMSRVSYLIARSLVRVTHVGMPNIVLGEEVVPELIQTELTPERLRDELTRYLDDEHRSAEVSARLAEVRELLVRPGAAARAAELALEMIA